MGVARFRAGDATGSLVGSVVVAIALFPAIHQAQAHEAGTGWTYPPECCKGDALSGECQRIPNRSVEKGPRGFLVALGRGDHPRVMWPELFLIPCGDELPSGDSNFHICLHSMGGVVYCFFAPPDGA
jgi:hypothetical protein